MTCCLSRNGNTREETEWRIERIDREGQTRRRYALHHLISTGTGSVQWERSTNSGARRKLQRLAFNFYFHYHFIISDSARRSKLSFLQFYLVFLWFIFKTFRFINILGKMSFVNVSTEIPEESDVETEFRSTRIAPASTLMIGTAVLTQLMVLSGVAVIMGVAVVTMCAFIVELLVLTIVATALERGVFNFEDLGTVTEIAATLLFTFTTVMLAMFGSGKKSDGPSILDASSITALKLS